MTGNESETTACSCGCGSDQCCPGCTRTQQTHPGDTAGSCGCGQNQCCSGQCCPGCTCTQQTHQGECVSQDAYLRLAAEYDNYRKRTALDVARAREEGQLSVLVALGPAMTALGAATKMGDLSPNMARVGDAVRAGLAQLGVRSCGAAGEKFNPNIHEAIAVSTGPEGVVLEVYSQGWATEAACLVPAKVVVGNGEVDTNDSGTNDSGTNDSGTNDSGTGNSGSGGA